MKRERDRGRRTLCTAICTSLPAAAAAGALKRFGLLHKALCKFFKCQEKKKNWGKVPVQSRNFLFSLLLARSLFLSEECRLRKLLCCKLCGSIKSDRNGGHNRAGENGNGKLSKNTVEDAASSSFLPRPILIRLQIPRSESKMSLCRALNLPIKILLVSCRICAAVPFPCSLAKVVQQPHNFISTNSTKPQHVRPLAETMKKYYTKNKLQRRLKKRLKTAGKTCQHKGKNRHTAGHEFIVAPLAFMTKSHSPN